MSSRLQLDMRSLSLGRLYLVCTYEVKAGIGVIAGNTMWSMPERLECEVLQKARYINTLTFTRSRRISSGCPADATRRASQIKCDPRRSPSSFVVPYQALSQKKYFRRSSLQRCLTSLTDWPLVVDRVLLSKIDSNFGQQFNVKAVTSKVLTDTKFYYQWGYG